ncbi:MAG: biotin/lipoyl-binding protein, partial [Chloroflexales bacterium]
MPTPVNEQTRDVARTLGVGTTSRRRRLLRVVVPACVILAFAWAGIRAQRARTLAAGVVHYETRPVTRDDLIKTVSATGTLQPVKVVDVGIEVSGTIKSVDADYNDQVTNGQALARIDTSKLEAQALQAEAALEAARAGLLQVQATVLETQAQLARLTRVRELSGGKAPSQAEFDTQQAAVTRAQANEASARAAITQATATLNVNRADLKKAVIHSP